MTWSNIYYTTVSVCQESGHGFLSALFQDLSPTANKVLARALDTTGEGSASRPKDKVVAKILMGAHVGIEPVTLVWLAPHSNQLSQVFVKIQSLIGCWIEHLSSLQFVGCPVSCHLRLSAGWVNFVKVSRPIRREERASKKRIPVFYKLNFPLLSPYFIYWKWVTRSNPHTREGCYMECECQETGIIWNILEGCQLQCPGAYYSVYRHFGNWIEEGIVRLVSPSQ